MSYRARMISYPPAARGAASPPLGSDIRSGPIRAYLTPRTCAYHVPVHGSRRKRSICVARASAAALATPTVCCTSIAAGGRVVMYMLCHPWQHCMHRIPASSPTRRVAVASLCARERDGRHLSWHAPRARHSFQVASIAQRPGDTHASLSLPLDAPSILEVCTRHSHLHDLIDERDLHNLLFKVGLRFHNSWVLFLNCLEELGTR